MPDINGYYPQDKLYFMRSLKLTIWVRGGEVYVRWDNPLFQSQGRLDETG